MGKTAVQVQRGDERVGDDGSLHRVLNRSVDVSGAVTIAYDVLSASGAKTLHFDTIPEPDVRTSDTGFVTPGTTSIDEFEPA